MLPSHGLRPYASVIAALICALLIPIQTASRAGAQAGSREDPERIPAPENEAIETIGLLQGNHAGLLSVSARGHGQERVRLTIRNSSNKRLHVVLPPGLIASAGAGQGQGRGGGGFQSMGLGMLSNRPGAFGRFHGDAADQNPQLTATNGSLAPEGITVPATESLEVTVPAVCLNYGLPTPTARDRFQLMDVNDYSADPRVRRALRSLSLIGTSQGVAQAVMWRVCNDLSFETMAGQAGKVINEYDIALAARFIEVLDQTTESSLVDAKALAENRVFVRIQGDDALASETRRLNEQINGCRLLGLPARSVENGALPSVPSAILIHVDLYRGKLGATTGRILVSSCSAADQWVPLGRVKLQDDHPLDGLESVVLAQLIDRAVSAGFVSVKPARHAVGSTILRVENRLPFTVAHLAVKAGTSLGAPSVSFNGVGIGPARAAMIPIAAATAVVEHVEANGL